jgi:predicted Zn-dependent protease
MAIAGCLAIGAVLFLYFIAVPLIAMQAKHWVSPTMEAALGQQTADTIIQLLTHPSQPGKSDKAECQNPRGLAAMARLVSPLVSQVNLKNPPQIRVVNAPLINAVALPGGQVLVFRGMIDFASGPNEVAGVLAHEFGHIELGHPIVMMIDRGSKSFLIGLLFGDVLGGSAAAGIAQAALDAKYSRDMERAADVRGIELLVGAGLDAGPFGTFFLRLATKQQNNAMMPFFESHPPSEERAKLIEMAPVTGRVALDADDWKALKSICD